MQNYKDYRKHQRVKYSVNDYGPCTISHVDKGNVGYFFMIDKKNDEHLTLLTLQQTECESLKKIPEIGEVFGVFLDEEKNLFRAIRHNNQNDLYLVDIGEILHDIDFADYDIVSLPKNIEELPPQAIYCKLVSVAVNRDPETFLEENIYSNLYYKVLKIESDIPHVIVTNEPENHGVLIAEKVQHSLDLSQNQVEIDKNSMRNQSNQFELKSTESQESNCIKITKESLTPTQQKILFDETLSTENAMVAVLGYDVKDDARICPHYNPKTKACFKGGWCKLQHVPKLRDGWTRDTEVTKTQIRAILEYPAIKAEINIIPTHIIDVNHMYAHILINKQREPSNNLEELAIKLQNTNKIALKRFPVVNELVLALYKDNTFYRGKVLEEINDQWYKIFYVDFGNVENVTFDNLREWTSDFDYLPYQAVAVCIANIKPFANRDIRSTECFNKMVLNRVVKAEVVDNIDDLFVKIFDDEGFDIGEILIALNMALPHVYHIPTKQNGHRMYPV